MDILFQMVTLLQMLLVALVFSRWCFACHKCESQKLQLMEGTVCVGMRVSTFVSVLLDAAPPSLLVIHGNAGLKPPSCPRVMWQDQFKPLYVVAIGVTLWFGLPTLEHKLSDRGTSVTMPWRKSSSARSTMSFPIFPLENCQLRALAYLDKGCALGDKSLLI